MVKVCDGYICICDGDCGPCSGCPIEDTDFQPDLQHEDEDDGDVPPRLNTPTIASGV